MALTDNLISSYTSLGDSLNDEHGSNNLTQQGTLTSVSGLLGNALDNDGSSSNYLTGFPSMYGKTTFSVEIWCHVDVINCMIVAQNNTSTSRTFYVYCRATTGNTEFEANNDAGTNISCIQSGVNLSSAGWHHVVATADIAGNITLYVDDDGSPGSAAASGTTFGYLSDAAVYAFRRQSGSALAMNGQINTVRFWDRELTSAEVTELYNSGSGRDYAYISGGGPAEDPTEAGAINFGGGL